MPVPTLSKIPSDTSSARMVGPAEVAQLMSIGRRTFDRLRSRGEVPDPDFQSGRVIRWWPETIERWLGRCEEG